MSSGSGPFYLTKVDYTIYLESKMEIKGAPNIENVGDKEVKQRSRDVVWVLGRNS